MKDTPFMRLLVFCVFGILLSSNSNAIVSMQSLHLDEPKPGWRGGVDLGLNGSLGNTENFRLNGGGIILNYHNNVTHYLSVKSLYGESSGVEDQNKSFVHIRRIQDVSDRWSWELFAQAEDNKFARLNLRALAGAGGRFKIFNDKNNTLLSGFGAFYSLEDIESLPTDNEGGSHKNFTGNFYVVYKKNLFSDAEFVSTTYFQPRFDDFNDGRLTENATFKFKLTSAVSLKLSLDMVYDSKPPTSIKKTDVNYSSGIEYSF